MRSPQRRLARLLRSTGAGLLFSALVLTFVGGSSTPATAATRVAVTGNYYWASQPDPLPPPVGQPAGNLPNPTVPAGDWAVASVNGASNMETFIHLDLSALPMPGTATNFILHLSEDAGSSGTQAGAVITAAYVNEYFGDPDAARPYNERPTVGDTPAPVQGQRSTTGEWTWDVTAMVTKCLSNSETACGLALRPGGGTFQANFAGPTTPDDPTGTRHKPFAEGDATATSTDTGGSTGTDTTGTDTSGTDSGADTAGSFGSVTSPPVESPPIASVPDPINTPLPPAAAPPTTEAPQPLTRVATGGKPDHSLPLTFFLAALGVVALLGSFMFALGEAGEPTISRTGTVFKTLDARLAARAASAKE